MSKVSFAAERQLLLPAVLLERLPLVLRRLDVVERERDVVRLRLAGREPLERAVADRDALLRLAVDRRRPLEPLRSAAGISACATARVSTGIWRSRNDAIRSSSRRIWRASFAVSLSPTLSASVSIAR
jgi:hypothetical protein